MAPVWVNWWFNFPRRNFGIRSPFDVLNRSLEISIQGIQLFSEKHWYMTHISPHFPKKCRLGPQNGSGSSGPEKLLKIVSCAETYKLK